MFAHSTIRDDENITVRHERQIMRTETVRGKFADAPKAGGHVVDADPTRTVRKGILRAVE